MENNWQKNEQPFHQWENSAQRVNLIDVVLKAPRTIENRGIDQQVDRHISPHWDQPTERMQTANEELMTKEEIRAGCAHVGMLLALRKPIEIQAGYNISQLRPSGQTTSPALRPTLQVTSRKQVPDCSSGFTVLLVAVQRRLSIRAVNSRCICWETCIYISIVGESTIDFTSERREIEFAKPDASFFKWSGLSLVDG